MGKLIYFLFTRDEPFEVMSLNERCPVCEEIPTVCKNLSCGHRLCENCVQFLLPVGGDSLHCPTCSCDTRLVETPNTGLHTATPAGHAGTNFTNY